MGTNEGDSSEIFLLGLAALLLINILVAIFLEVRKIKILHETMIILVLSIAFTLTYKFYTGILITDSIQPETIFEYILPPIIFAAGYNIRKQFFFKNFIPIVAFGFIGTLVGFFVSTAVFYYTHNKMLDIWDLGKAQNYQWSLLSVMKIAVTLGASDTVAPLTTIDELAYPTLFSIVFGEGVCNDAVALILMTTTEKLQTENAETISVQTLISFFIDFFKTSTLSVLLGIFAGIISCLLHKRIVSLNHFPILESSMVLLMAISTYTFCELPQIELASVVAIFTFGIMQSHYNKYNLSKESFHKTGFVFGMLSWVCEAFILIYMGLSFDKFSIDQTIVIYAISDLVMVVIIRFVVVFIMNFFLRIFSKSKVSLRNTILISLSGLIRGAIAYSILVRLCLDKDEFMLPITQTLIVLTIFLFTPFNQWMTKLLGKIETTELALHLNTTQKIKEPEEEIHEEHHRRANFKTFDELFIKPFLIRNYSKRAAIILEGKIQQRHELQEKFEHGEDHDHWRRTNAFVRNRISGIGRSRIFQRESDTDINLNDLRDQDEKDIENFESLNN